MTTNASTTSESAGGAPKGGADRSGPSGQKKTLIALLVLLVGGAGTVAAFKWMNGEKPVPSAAQDNAEKLRSTMQKAESEARAKAPPADAPEEPAAEPTRAARGVK